MAIYDSQYTGQQIDAGIFEGITVKRIDIRLAAGAEYTFTERIDFMFISWNIGVGKSAYVIGGTIEQMTLPVAAITAVGLSFASDNKHLILKNNHSAVATFYVYAMIRD